MSRKSIGGVWSKVTRAAFGNRTGSETAKAAPDALLWVEHGKPLLLPGAPGDCG